MIQLEKEVQSLEGDKSNLNLRGKYDSLEKEMKDKNRTVDGMTKERDKLKEEVTSKTVELVMVTKDLEHARDQMNKLEDQMKKLNSELQQSKNECEEHRSKSVELKLELSEANIHLGYLRKDYPFFSKKQGSMDGCNPGEHIYCFFM